MPFRFVIAALLSLVCFFLPVRDTAQTARLDVLSSEQGLSQGMIYDILQDRTGFLWFSTRDGLNRYDGYTFTVFKNDPFNSFSVSDNVIKVLFEDHLGRIWIGTETNGVDVFDPVTARFFHLSKGPNGLPNQNINAFAETQDGAMWVGTQYGLSRVVLPADLPVQNADLSAVAKLEHFFWEGSETSSIGSNIYTSLLAAENGILWVGTGRDAFRFDTKTGQRALIPVRENLAEQPNLCANYFEKAPDGSIWLGQFNRIIRIDGERTTIFPLPQSKKTYAASLAFDLDGNLFVCHRKEIFYFAKVDLGEASNNGGGNAPPVAQTFFSFPEKDIIGASHILCDRGGLIWIGTNGYGIRKFNPVNRLFKHCLSGVSTRKIRPNTNGELWVWTSTGMFSLLDEQKDAVVRPLLEDKNLFHHDCVFGRDGTLWVLAQQRSGADGNCILIKRNLQTGAEERINNLVYAGIYSQILEGRNGELWLLGSKSDLARYDPATRTAARFDLSQLTGFKEYSSALMEDGNGHIWVGTPHGLVHGTPDPKNGSMSFSIFKNTPANPNSLSSNAILSLHDDDRDPSRFMWVGTRGGGLNLLNKISGECRHFAVANGLPNDVIYGILIDSNRCLWLSTNFGISKYNPVTNYFENYSAADGLQDNEFNTISYAQKSDGQMVFGGVNGLTIFDPRLINPVSSTPAVRITVLKIQNKKAMPGDGVLSRTIEQTQTVTLQHDQNDISFEFVALDFSTPQKNQFRYRLLGAHDEWSEATTDHSTTFSNLPPGKYTFEVVTGGAHGIWKGTPASIEIEILAPWWKSNPALICYLLLLIWAGWEVYRFQIRRVQLQEQLAFEHRESERIRAIEQMKTNFFSNITHELRTPVTLILEPLRQILHDPTTGNWLSKVRLAEGNSRKLLQLVNQLLDLAKLEGGAMHPEYRRGQVADLLYLIADSFAEKAQSKNISLQCSQAAVIDLFDFDADKLGKIATNLLSNALKFTPAGGKVSMAWQTTPEGWFLLEVQDTGPGIATGDLPKVFDRFFSKGNSAAPEETSTGIGLALCRELAELMGGRLGVESREGEGATFRLWLPVRYSDAHVVAEFIDPLPENKPAFPEIPDTSVVALEAREANVERPLLLLAEDNQELRRFIAQTLSRKFEVLEAVDGQDAVELARARVPDIVVSDLMMPRLDGIGLLIALKNDIATSHIPTLLLTAKMGLESRLEGIQHGADAYLGKPFQTEELFAWLDNLLENRRRLQASFSQPKTTQGTVSNRTDQPATGPSATEISLSILDRKFLERLREITEAEMDNDQIKPEEIARRMAMSRSQLHRKLSAITGLSISEYMRNARLDRAFELLQSGAGNVSEVAFQVGFVNAKHFSTSFKERFGKSPSEV